MLTIEVPKNEQELIEICNLIFEEEPFEVRKADGVSSEQILQYCGNIGKGGFGFLLGYQLGSKKPPQVLRIFEDGRELTLQVGKKGLPVHDALRICGIELTEKKDG